MIVDIQLLVLLPSDRYFDDILYDVGTYILYTQGACCGLQLLLLLPSGFYNVYIDVHED